MTCGSCGAPLAEGIGRCPFCGASAKYALTEAGNLPYEYVAETPQHPKVELRQPRWDLEKPQGTSHSYYKSMRSTFERWAALERRRQIGRSPLGCFLSTVLLALFVGSCSLFALLSSLARMQNGGTILTARDITATEQANPNPYPPGQGLLTLDNILQENGNEAWTNYSSDTRAINQGCTFQNGSYDTSKPAHQVPTIKYCLANNTNFRNFTYEIAMNTIQGNCGGIVFRENAPDEYYYFFICRNGRYALWMNSKTQGKILAQGTSTAVLTGEDNQMNTLAVVAIKLTMNLYVNRQLLVTVHDKTYSAGKIGTAVGAPDRGATECTFNDAKVWIL